MAPEITPEPRDSPPKGSTKDRPNAPGLRFVVQKHQASRLHCDFRLEWKGLLLSWAIPKCPSLDPKIKRLAMQLEGVLPEAQDVTARVWDQGLWIPKDPDVDSSLAAGQIKFRLKGKKLTGGWVLVRTKALSWLLIKHQDKHALPADVPAQRRVKNGGA